MEESILTSIKSLLGPYADNTDFDSDIIIHINTAFMVLSQLGIGPDEGFKIEDDKADWSDYGIDKLNLEGVKTYVYLKVKLMFDPPSNSNITNSIKEQINELEWRLTNH